jgi:hypothetical protein
MSRKNGGIIGPANTPVGGLFNRSSRWCVENERRCKFCRQ